MTIGNIIENLVYNMISPGIYLSEMGSRYLSVLGWQLAYYDYSSPVKGDKSPTFRRPKSDQSQNGNFVVWSGTNLANLQDHCSQRRKMHKPGIRVGATIYIECTPKNLSCEKEIE